MSGRVSRADQIIHSASGTMRVDTLYAYTRCKPMPITYTNRRGMTFYLCQSTTKTGKPRYYFAREPRGSPVEQVPEGFRISEGANGLVSLERDRPSQILL